MGGLGVNESLSPNQECRSDDGKARLVFQGDGNLVLYVQRPGGEVARWASNTAGRPAVTCVMQGDGNLVLYDAANKPLWNSKTYGHAGATLTVQDDENVVIYDNGSAIWSTDTWIAAWRDTGFDKNASGLRFTNKFPDANIGGIHLTGLCGGMTFTTLDYHYAGRPAPRINAPPATESTKLGGYIKGRHVQSLVNLAAATNPLAALGIADIVGLIFGIPPADLGAGIVHVAANVPNYNLQQFLALQGASDATLRDRSFHAEFTKLKAAVDSGRPVPIGLISRGGGLTDAHQMAAVGYRDGKKDKWIHVWDQNDPAAGIQEIWVSLDHDLYQTIRGFAWRGFFVEEYAPESPPLTGANENALTERRAFDANLYLHIYDDLTAVFGGDVNAARTHWLSYGTREGRRASTQLDPAYYLSQYGDLVNAFGADNYESAVEHWINNGIGEGRRSSLEFDVAWYLSNHADLIAAFGSTNYAAAADHWLNNGLGEGRQSSASFNVSYYLSSNADLVAAFGANNYRAAFEHWLHYGKNEGRKSVA